MKHTLETRGFGLSEEEVKAHELLRKDRKAMDIMAVFGGRYGEANIKNDLEYVRGRKAIFGKENIPGEEQSKKLAELFEMLFAKLTELENWLGEDAFIMETSEYDDIYAGIDMVVEILRDGAFSHLGLAIDVTFSVDKIDKKLKRIKDEIVNGELPTVRYFVSEQGDFKGELSNVPRVVVAVDRKTLRELASSWLDIDFLRKRLFQAQDQKTKDQLKTRLREIQSKLANHPLQIEVLDQIEIQLKTFATYASREAQIKKSEKFINILSIVRGIRSGKKELEKTPQAKTWPRDSLANLENALDRTFPSAIEN